MGLRAVLGRLAARRPHVLLVAVPGTTPIRLAVERWCREHDAVLTAAPADADLLVVTGPAQGDLAAAVDGLWRQLPGPRVRADLESAELVPELLNVAQARLADADGREQLAQRGDEWEAGHLDMGDMDMGEMEMPAGLMMADRAEDRDGLKLDVLPVALGPVLPGWPTGLIIDVMLQGDVIQQAELRGRPVPGPAFWPSHPLAARLDRAAGLLRLLGWDAAAARAISLRDQAIDSGPTGPVAVGVVRLQRRVGRSRLVCHSLRGLAPVDGRDAYHRLLGWLSVDHDESPFSPAVERTCELMVGHDLAVARLLLASLPPDLDIPAPAPAGAGEDR